MTKLYKSLAITLAIAFGISFLSRQVKAVAGGVAAAGAAVAASIAFTYMCGQFIDDICKSISSAASGYARETDFQVLPEISNSDNLARDVKAEFESYMAERNKKLGADNYNQEFASMSNAQRVALVTNAQEYINSLTSSPTAAQLVTASILRSIEDNASGMLVASDGTVSMKGNVFSQLYGGVLQDSLSNICGVEVNVSKEAGISGRDVLMSNPAATTYFPTLAAMYEATHVYELSFNSSKNAYLKLSTSYLGTERYYILIHNGTLTCNDVIYARFVRQNASNVKVPAADHISLQFMNNTKNHYNLHAFIQNADTDVTAYTGDMIYFGVGDSFTSSLDIKTDLAFDFLGSYVFEFDDLEKAQSFVADIAADSEALAFYDPATDFDTTIVGIKDGLSWLEKAVAARQAELGTDEYLDIVISPGLSIDENGEAVYNPSISIGKAATNDLVNANDVDVSQVVDITDVEEMEIEASFFIEKFPFSLPFDFYRVLTLFVRDPVPPVFEIPIQGELKGFGLNEKVDETLVVDLTIFKINGVDIVQSVLRFSFIVGFVILLIKTTTKFFV